MPGELCILNIDVIGAWKRAGEPAEKEIRAFLIKDKPEGLLKTT